MEKAKQTIAKFISNDGRHKTIVDQDVRGGVTEEHVHPHQHENVTTAIDKEIHQDHHQTIIQPYKTQETLPEKHTHNARPVENKTFHHGNETDLQETLNRDATKYKDTTVTHDTTHSTTTEPALVSEHTYHHVHHHLQPVIQKETVQPHVVHTTVPIHETHHAVPIHHEATVLPTKTMDAKTSIEYEKSLKENNAKKVSEFEGCPTLKDKVLQSDPQTREMIHGH
ncbi:allergen [Mariannaea sp. PMI_226]|nr:allergen [Mariannaea sp. PMI_226]